jgi:hypothetical protein
MGGIALIDVVDEMAAILAADAALASWASTTYGTTVTILLGMDERNRPGADACPLIVLRPETSRTGEEQELTVLVDWAVHDDSVTVTGSVTRYDGVQRLDDMGGLILAALESGMPQVLGVRRDEYVLETVERFPMLLGGMDITITVPLMLNGTQITF